jgi:hypothetical protein
MVEGYAGFLFLDKNDMPLVALTGKVSEAYHSEIQQDLPYPDAQSYPSCMQAHLFF